MAISRSAWERGIRTDYIARKKAIRDARDTKTVVISEKWRSGFRDLKAENDRLQIERDETYHRDMVENDTWLREQLALGPPAG